MGDLAMPSLAEILNKLFQRHLKGNGKPYSNEDLASWARERGVEMSQAHVWNLRQVGRPSDPRASHIKIIAEFFGYQPGYLIDPQVYRSVEQGLGYGEPSTDVEMDIPVQAVMPTVMLRKVAEMSPQSKALIEGLINQVSELEHGHARNDRQTRP